MFGFAFVALFFFRGTCVFPIARAREAVLRNDLAEMRLAIRHYTADKQQAPQSLENLVDARYLHQIPINPCTMKKDWVPVFGDVAADVNHKSYGITDIHSAADNGSSRCEFASER